MSKARGLISGGDFASRTSGMYDSADNIRLSHISPAGFKKLGNKRLVKFETGQTSPQSFAWSPDGLHFYLAYSGDYIKHYECTSPFNLSGASVQATFNHSSWESACYGIEVSPDGRYLYIGGLDRDTVTQFTMVNQWQISASATSDLFNPGYEQQNKRLNNIFSIGTSDSNVRGFDFNGDGTKFYMTGISDDNVQQFSLSSAYDVGTASYDGAYSHGLNAPTEVRWNNDGTKFFIVSYSPNDEVVEYSVSTAYDVTSTVTEGTHFALGSYDTLPMGVAFNANGTQMFVVGVGSDKIHEWTLSTGFDLSSTVTYVSGTATGLSTPSHLEFNPAGTKLLVLNYEQYGNDLIRAYNLSTAFDSSTISDYETIDISTPRWATSSSVNGLTNHIVTPSGLRFNGDGTTVTTLDRHDSNYDKAVSIPLLTPYELSTYTDGVIENSNTVFNYPCTFRFNPDGTKCYILDVSDDRIYQYSLTKPYVLGRGSSVMTYDGMSSVLTDTDSVMRSFDFTPDGKGIYTCGSSQDTISHYTVSVPFDVTSTLTLTDKIDTTSYFETEPMEIRVVNTFDGGYKLHFLGTGADDLFELDINF
tara:strand:+ start:452 stop:2212 length:1761 start_codon:yes stop_codon:yes gene_type:complete